MSAPVERPRRALYRLRRGHQRPRDTRLGEAEEATWAGNPFRR
jgi:hypothetical protein